MGLRCTVKLPMTLKFGQIILVTVKYGKNYQLSVGDVITKEFLADENIEQVRLIRVDGRGAVYNQLLKIKTVNILEIKRLQKELGFNNTTARLAEHLLKSVERGETFDDFNNYDSPYNFNLCNVKGECIRTGKSFKKKDRMAAIILAATINPQVFMQSEANLYENYRRDGERSYNIRESMTTALKREGDPEHKATAEHFKQEYDDWIEMEMAKEQLKEDSLISKATNVVKLNPPK